MQKPANCPCGSGKAAEQCCAPRLAGKRLAETAEALMRSRYTAFSCGDVDYLLATHHPSRQAPNEHRQLQHNCATTQWLSLEIIEIKAGAVSDSTGEVEFIARYLSGGQLGQLQERSRFVKEYGRWLYVDGDIKSSGTLPEPGRNAPCGCGSGKKYKKCHGG